MRHWKPLAIALFVVLFATPAGAEDLEELTVPYQDPEAFGLEDFDDDLAEIAGAEIKLRETVIFHYGRAKVRDVSQPVLRRVADLLRAMPEVRQIRIEGHTDSTGYKSYNQKLSEQRADRVMEHLTRLGVSDSRLQAVGYGETRPVVPNETKRQLQTNRRVEFRFVGAEEWARERREPAEATVVSSVGPVDFLTGPDERQEVQQWSRLAGGTVLETGADGSCTLRFDDLGVLKVEPGTRLKLVRLEFEPDSGTRRLGVKLLRGTVEWNDPETAETVLFGANGSFVTQGAHGRITNYDGTIVAALYEGAGEAVTRNTSITLDALDVAEMNETGSRLLKSLDTQGPRHMNQADGEVSPDARLSWKADETRGGFRIEVSSEPQFVDVRQRHDVDSPGQILGTLLLPDGQETYLRVRAVSESGALGLPGPVIRLRTMPQPEQDKERN